MADGARSERVIAIFDADGRRLNAGLDRMEKKVSGFSRGLKKSLGALRSVTGIGGIGAALGGAFAVVDVAGQVLDFEKSLARLGVAANGAYGDLSGIRAQIAAVSRETGVSRQEILNSAAAYLSLTGDAKGAAAQMATFARIQVATGAAMDDVSAAAAALVQNLQIDPADMEKAFSVLVASGKAGAVELRDMAAVLAELAPLSARFAGGSGIRGLNNLSAALQLVRQGFGGKGATGAQKAATGLEALMGAIVQHADKLEKAGVKVFETDEGGTKRLRAFQQIIEDISNSELARDPTLLIKALGRKEAEQAYIQLVKVKGAWDNLAEAAANANDISRDYATIQASSAMQIQKSWELVKLSIAEVFTPERIKLFAQAMEVVVAMAADLVNLLGKVARLVETVADVAGVTGSKGMESIPAEENRAMAEALIKEGRTPEEVERGTFGGIPNRFVADEMRKLGWQKSGVAQRAEGFRARLRAESEKRGLAEPESLRIARQNSFERANERLRSMFGVRISMDRDANLKAAVDNHRSQRR